MARAKMTDRAEARRRYRAYLAQQEGAIGADEVDEEASGVAPAVARARSEFARGPRETRQTAPAPGARVGIFQAMKLAYRTPHYRDDLRNVGAVLRSHAIWPGLVLCLVAVAVSLGRISSTTLDQNDPVLSITFQWILLVPVAPAAIAGFLTPRASWLAGIIAAAIASLLATLVVAKVDGVGALNIGNVAGGALNSFSTTLPFGALFAAAAAWYRRFLPLTSGPNPRSKPGAAKSGSARTARR